MNSLIFLRYMILCHNSFLQCDFFPLFAVHQHYAHKTYHSFHIHVPGRSRCRCSEKATGHFFRREYGCCGWFDGGMDPWWASDCGWNISIGCSNEHGFPSALSSATDPNRVGMGFDSVLPPPGKCWSGGLAFKTQSFCSTGVVPPISLAWLPSQ